MKIIMVDKPWSCPHNCDGYCAVTGNCASHCTDDEDTLDFPDDCPLKDANTRTLLPKCSCRGHMYTVMIPTCSTCGGIVDAPVPNTDDGRA